jgi:PAS domain-containing protein
MTKKFSFKPGPVGLEKGINYKTPKKTQLPEYRWDIEYKPLTASKAMLDRQPMERGTWATPEWLETGRQSSKPANFSNAYYGIDPAFVQTPPYIPENRNWLSLGAIRAGHRVYGSAILLDDWFRQVPEGYRNTVTRVVVSSLERYRGQKLDDSLVDALLADIFESINYAVEVQDSEYRREVQGTYMSRRFARYYGETDAELRDRVNAWFEAQNQARLDQAMVETADAYTYSDSWFRDALGGVGLKDAINLLTKIILTIGNAWANDLTERGVIDQRTAALDLAPGKGAIVVDLNEPQLKDLLELHEKVTKVGKL